MARTIWKFQLHRMDRQVVTMPGSFRILCVQFQGADLFVWAEVEPDGPAREVPFFVVGTGNPLSLPSTARYLGTVFESAPAFVWHVYADLPERIVCHHG